MSIPTTGDWLEAWLQFYDSAREILLRVLVGCAIRRAALAARAISVPAVGYPSVRDWAEMDTLVVLVRVSGRWNILSTFPSLPLAKINETKGHLVVRAGGEEHVLRGGVPQHQPHAPLVVHQVHHWLGERARQTTVRDLPHLEREW